MKKIKNYIELAHKKTGIKSQNQLARKIGISGASLSRIASGASIPSEGTILKLADLAGVSKEQALLERSYWLADAETKPIYHKILEGVKKGAAVILLMQALSANPAVAGVTGELSAQSNSPVYILSHRFRLWLKRLLLIPFYNLRCDKMHQLGGMNAPIFRSSNRICTL